MSGSEGAPGPTEGQTPARQPVIVSDSGMQRVQAICITCAANPGTQPGELWVMWARQHVVAHEGHRVSVSYQRVTEYAVPR